MLSGETAKGNYPIQSGELRIVYFHSTSDLFFYLVLMMAETCLLAEYAVCHAPLFDNLRSLQPRPTETAETVGIAAVAAASEQKASAILVLTTGGNTARFIAKYRPEVPILTGRSFC